jgi:branched-subunit amino acid transport protein
MSGLAIWGTIAGMALVTLLLRLSFIAAWGRIELPEGARDALRFVPPAVLAASVTPALALRAGQIDLSVGNERLVAGLVAMLVAWRTRNALATIAAGMGALLLATVL